MSFLKAAENVTILKKSVQVPLSLPKNPNGVIIRVLGILCHRPPVKCHGLHVSLQVEAFATFMDDIKCDESELESKYIKIALELMHQQNNRSAYEINGQQ